MTTGRLVEWCGERVSAETLQFVAEEIRAVEQELARQMRSQVQLVERVGLHTLEAGGKRLRPAFVTLAAHATGLPFDAARTRKLGACMEMIHMATLMHDDVIDHAATRRGRPTAASIFGNTPAILTGDALLSRAMAVLAQDGDLAIIRNVSSAVVELAEGEVRELETRGVFDLTEEEHLEILRMKTAVFIQSCCEIGALAAGAPQETVAAVGRYGHHVGMAFQIVDDLLDYRGEHAATGKPRATDFREGCATLPLIALRPLLSPGESDEVRAFFGNGVDETGIARVCALMDQRDAFAVAEKAARHHVEAAQHALATLPEGESRRLLEGVAEFVVARDA
ncbi:MAG: polyprenyl synthetase family protein [Fimbriimonadaceae bacterium]|nr:polyprenyl synthetase family protein [Fimbriimonadaceae bacterium]